MMRSMFAVLAAAMLVAACDEPAPQTAAPAAPPPQPASFMVTFATNSAALTPQSMATIQQAAAAAKGGARVSLTGNTDTMGDATYNQMLSERRANAVRDALVNAGVPAGNIAAAGRGETALPVQTADNVAEARNRSVTIAVAGAAAPSNDQAYCAALSAKYRSYRSAQIDQNAANAMAQCTAGNYAAGIPVLEQILTNDKVALPPRT